MSNFEKVAGLLILLVPQLLMLFLTKSFASIFVFLACVTGSVLSEAASYYLKKETSTLEILTSVLQGSLVGLLLPSSYSVFGSFLIVFCVFLILKYSYGYFSDNWLNPICLCLVICYISGHHLFPSFILTHDHLASKNPSLVLINEGVFPLISCDVKITAFLNSTVFKLLNISIPDGYVSLLWDTHSAIPAFRFNLFTIISSVFIFALGIADVFVPAMMLLFYSLLVFITGSYFFGGTLFSGDIILAIFTSGVMFHLLFVIQWFGTLPVTRIGKFVFAVFAAATCFFINGYGLSPIGTAYTILLSNVFSTLIQYFEEIRSSHHFRKKLIPRITAFKGEE